MLKKSKLYIILASVVSILDKDIKDTLNGLLLTNTRKDCMHLVISLHILLYTVDRMTYVGI